MSIVPWNYFSFWGPVFFRVPGNYFVILQFFMGSISLQSPTFFRLWLLATVSVGLKQICGGFRSNSDFSGMDGFLGIPLFGSLFEPFLGRKSCIFGDYCVWCVPRASLLTLLVLPTCSLITLWAPLRRYTRINAFLTSFNNIFTLNDTYLYSNWLNKWVGVEILYLTFEDLSLDILDYSGF